MENKPLSIYIHIPFCVKKCEYCAFFSVPRRNDTLFDLYTEAVIKRLRSMDCHRVKSVYFGGGTPTVFGSDRLCRMLDAVFATQKVNAGAEITAEANPGTVSGTDFAVLSSAGFNRLSLGLQSADDAILKSIGRIHDLDMFLRCYDGAAKSFSNISVDIMFALPGGGVAETLGVINDIKPAHVSAYSLMLEMNTPMFENRDKYVFPGEDEEEAEYELICDTLSRSGYGHYEVSSFAKPGYRSRHNLGYWKREDYIGIGAAAHSFYKNRRFSAPPDIDLFIQNSDKPFTVTGDTDFASAAEISAEEAETERVMLGLRTSDGVALDEERLKKAKKFADGGFGKIEGDIFSLNDRGFRVSNAIIRELVL